MADTDRSRIDRAALALSLLAVDPAGLGGIWLRGRAGPARDVLLSDLSALPAPIARVPPTATDDTLFGGVDIAETLAGGRIVRRSGILARSPLILVPMAERLPAPLAARLAHRLDGGGHCMLALDEGTEDEALPRTLQDRLAFRIDLDDMSLSETAGFRTPGARITAARARLATVTETPQQIADLTQISARLGIDSLRAVILALRTARAHAALAGRDHLADADILAAVDLTLAHRATQLPEDAAQDAEPDDRPDDTDQPRQTDEIPQDLVLEAVKAALPAGLLDQSTPRAARGVTGAGSGARRKGNRRGRPLPPRPGQPHARARIDLVATLRAAAPWQTIRARAHPGKPRVHVRRSDIHIKRFELKSDRLLIFAVDASGSAALARLAEAKGAVELLLSEAYARRDHVALVAFRGAGADLLLPPTRSLVQTKRRLAALPGGGGTPLATGLQAAMEQALVARGRGLSPTIVLLTDGRANVALDGSADREQAADDATRLARIIRQQGIDALVIDTGNRPEPALRSLSNALAGPYVPLPRADAARLSQTVTAALEH